MSRPEVVSPRASVSRFRSWGRLALWSGGAVVAICAATSLWLPDWVKPKIEGAASEALGVPVALQGLHIEPWRLAVGIEGLRVGETKAPIFQMAHAEVQLSLKSIWHLAPVISRVQVQAPAVFIERTGADRFNFSDIVSRFSQKPQDDAQPSSSAKFAVFNIELKDGAIHYQDAVTGQAHHVTQLNVGLPFLSNLPSHIEVDVQPTLNALIDGSPLKLEGKTLPFHEGHRSEIQLDWAKVDVAHWFNAAKAALPDLALPEIQSGQLSTQLAIHFEQIATEPVPSLRIKGGLALNALQMSMADAPGLGQVKAGWQSLAVHGLDVQPLVQKAQVGRVALSGASLQARPSSAKRVQTPESQDAAKASPAAAPEAAWQWDVQSVEVDVDQIDVQTDATQAWPTLRAKLTAQGLGASATLPAANWHLNVEDQYGAKLTAQGQLQLATQTVSAHIDLAQAQVPVWLAPLQGQLNLPMQVTKGDLSVQADVSSQWTKQAQLRDVKVQLNELSAHALAHRADQVQWQALSVDGVSLQLGLADGGAESPAGLQALHVDQIHFKGLASTLTRGMQGEWLALPQATKPVKATAASSTARKQVAAEPVLTLGQLKCEDCRIDVRDQSVRPAALVSLQDVDVSVSDVSNDLRKTMKLSVQASPQGAGRVGFEGTVRPAPLQVAGRVSASNVDLRWVQPYLDDKLNFQIAGAKVQANGRVQVSEHVAHGLSVRYQGGVGLSDLRLKDRINPVDFLSWRSLSLDGTDVQWRPTGMEANLGKISLRDFFGRVIVRPDGSLNLASLIKADEAAAATSLTDEQAVAEAPAPAASNAEASTQSAALKLRWQGLSLNKGRVLFTDNFIKPNYTANLTQIQGSISAVSADRPEPAEVNVAAMVDDGAPLKVTGVIHPFGARLFTDIEGSAKGIELTRLTPYAARYAGYAIEKGSLSTTVRYKIADGKLEADNQIYLDQLTFGERTDSPDATKLPVLFAVSLLQNRHGVIDVSLPISGSLDEPEFSVGGILVQVLGNLISKAVTAPFSLLSGGSDELGFVPFEAGSAVLSAQAMARLDDLASKLDDRPALKLDATGQADPVADEAGLRAAHVQRLMRRAKAKATGVEINEVQIAPAEHDKWLTAAYKAADIDKPRHLIGLPKALPPAEMTALLAASATVTEAELKRLADRRGDVVKAYLATKIEADRVLLTASKVVAGDVSGDKGTSSRVQFQLR